MSQPDNPGKPVQWPSKSSVCVCLEIIFRGAEPDENVGYQFSKYQTEPTSKLKTENLVSTVRFSKNRLQRFRDGFSRCFIQKSSSNMIGSTVKSIFLHAVSLHF